MQTDKDPLRRASPGLALIFAIVIGGIQEDVGGFAIGALLGVLLAQVLHLRTRTQTLSEQLKTLANASRAGATRATGRSSAACSVCCSSASSTRKRQHCRRRNAGGGNATADYAEAPLSFVEPALRLNPLQRRGHPGHRRLLRVSTS